MLFFALAFFAWLIAMITLAAHGLIFPRDYVPLLLALYFAALWFGLPDPNGRDYSRPEPSPYHPIE